MTKQTACVLDVLDFATRLRADVSELKLPDGDSQFGVTVGRSFDRSPISGFVPAIAQHVVAHAQASLVGDQDRSFGAGLVPPIK